MTKPPFIIIEIYKDRKIIIKSILILWPIWNKKFLPKSLKSPSSIAGTSPKGYKQAYTHKDLSIIDES